LKFLLTGGAGFIGSHLTDRLISDGHEVTVLDTFSTGRAENLAHLATNKSLTLVEGSILDKPLLEKLTEETDYVFHLAAAVGVFNIVDNPLESLLTNVRGTENALEAANKYKKPFFLTSSSEVYGKNSADSLSEGDDRIVGTPTMLRWSYSEAKAIDESLAYAYWTQKGLETRIVRFFNTVGPRQLGAYGMVIPRFIEAAVKNEPLTIYGDGTQTRCFAHIADVIDAVMAVAFSTATIGKVVNIGNNFEISMNDLAAMIIAQTGSSSEIMHLPYEVAYGAGFEDMARRVPNISLIKELTGWAPTRDLTQIIADVKNSL
jgi:UDP-glucose 4-epimerase